METESAGFISVELPSWLTDFLRRRNLSIPHISSVRRRRRNGLSPVLIRIALDAAAAGRLVQVLTATETVTSDIETEPLAQLVSQVLSTPGHVVYPTWN